MRRRKELSMTNVEPSIYSTLSEWYDEYAASYKKGDPELEDAVSLKYGHTRRVVAEIRQLCESIALDRHMSMLAQIAALLHDVARFEQFSKYRTFSDYRSANHAEWAVDIILSTRLLSILDPDDARKVIGAIRHHNEVQIPMEVTGEERLLCQLLRDADKLDIYSIVLDHYINPQSQRSATVQIEIPEGSEVSPEICAGVLANENIPYEKIATLADFKIIQLGWIFDLNFAHTFRCIKNRGYVDSLKQHLPSTPDVDQIIAHVQEYLDRRVEEAKPRGN